LFLTPTAYPYQIPTTLSSNTWYHIIWVQKANTTYAYLNGTKTSQTSSISTFNYTNMKITIGSSTFTGWIDNVRLYNRALSDQECGYIYNNRV
jgi:cellulase/cellobiase CelA1